MPKPISTSALVRRANRWRDTLNPLRSLTIARAIALLEEGMRGEFADLQWTYQAIERRYPVLRALKARRSSALLKLDWDIKVPDDLKGPDKSLAKKQRIALRGIYDGLSNFREALRFLALAEFRGFAHLQKHRDAAGALRELHWLPQWNWVRDGMFGAWAYNADARQTGVQSLGPDVVLGEGLRREEFVVRECESPINEVGLIACVRASMGEKDWAAFVEIFGLPNCVIVMPESIPDGKAAEYQAAAEKVAEGASGAIPAGADAKFPGAAVRGNAPFREWVEWQEKDVVLAGTGGKLTMLTESGSGTLAGGAHQDTFDDIACSEAEDISEVLQRDLDQVELARLFPGQPVLAYFELAAPESEDQDRLADRVAKLSTAGFSADADELAEKLGLKLTAKAEPIAPAVPESRPAIPPAPEDPSPDPEDPPIANRRPAGDLQAAGVRQLASALAADLAPLRRRLAAVEKIEDPDIRKSRLTALLAEIDALGEDVLKDPESARTLEAIQGAAVVNGLIAPRAT